MSSNHKPNQEADRDPKRLLERGSLLCEQALCFIQVTSKARINELKAWMNISGWNL